ncbi:MAG: hypothetical protein KC635_24715 [Myxococcales bacterium]|nr:hypothetical protein [Myxococcales bacterium]MCB9735162.1 hypothetical protein [Deltaproteobacteria bacterium]
MIDALPDLGAFFAGVAATLPEDPRGEDGPAALTAQTLPAPPAALRVAGLRATWFWHWYEDSPAEHVSLEVDKPALRALGLLILATLLHPEVGPVTLHLDPTGADDGERRHVIDRLVVAPRVDADDAVGLVVRPRAFNYWPRALDKHPWFDERPAPDELPVITLRATDWALDELDGRHEAVGFGAPRPAARFAALCLDASRPGNDRLEIVLEGEQGFRGVGVGSAELTLWLPGSFGYG